MFAWRDQYLSFNGPSGPAGDPYWTYVSLLENFEYPQTIFADSSTNNFPITVVADVKPSLRTPFNGGGIYYDGAGDYLSVPANSAFTFGTNDFTVEFWVYPTTLVANTEMVATNVSGSNGYASVRVLCNASGQMYLLTSSTSGAWINTTLSASGTIVANTWQHIAAVRNGSTFTLYRNGYSVLTYTSANSLFDYSGATLIGGMAGQSFTGYLTGTISNLRITNGTAVYTSSFTPPSSPVTAITNTQLLINNSFADQSVNNFTVTKFGNSLVVPNGPYYQQGGSLYFDGSGDYCSLPDSDAYRFTGDFTMEAWVFPAVANSRRSILTHWPGAVAANCAFAFEVFSNNKVYYSYGINNTTGFYASTNTVSMGTWHHIAITRSGTTLRCFIDGIVEPNTLTLSGAFHNGTGDVRIGSMPTEGNFMNGFISNLRVINGTALYTSNFTIPSSPLTNVSGTSLLVTGTNQGLLNNSTFVDSFTTSTAALAQVSGPVYNGLSPFGNSYPGSLYCDGSGYLTAVSNAGYNLNNTNFTIEAWVNPENVTGTKAIAGIHVSGTGGWYMGLNGATTRFSSGAADYNFGTISANTWTHLAAVRNGTNLTFYINGVQSGSPVNVSAQNWNFTNPLWIGDINSTGWNFIGYISNFRITKAALYTSNFTPSTIPLTPMPNTTFLAGFNGANQDLSNSGQRVATTSSNCVISTQQKKFGTQSSLYTSTGYQTIYNYSSTSLQLTGDFTIEGWVYRTSVGTTHSIIGKGNSSLGWLLQINSSNQLTWTSGASIIKTSTTTIPANTWTYFAVTRSGSNCYMFINGTLEGSSFTDATSYNQSQDMKIGIDRSSANGLSGYLDDIRITKDVCRYSSSFTAPTESFPTS